MKFNTSLRESAPFARKVEHDMTCTPYFKTLTSPFLKQNLLK